MCTVHYYLFCFSAKIQYTVRGKNLAHAPTLIIFSKSQKDLRFVRPGYIYIRYIISPSFIGLHIYLPERVYRRVLVPSPRPFMIYER